MGSNFISSRSLPIHLGAPDNKAIKGLISHIST